jgi:hypothetical protein
MAKRRKYLEALSERKRHGEANTSSKRRFCCQNNALGVKK